MKTYIELCSERYDGSNSFLTTVRYGDIALSGLRTDVDDPLFISCSDYFGYVYNGNVNAASSRSISRSTTHDNLMTEELFNHDNFDAAAILSVL